MTPVVLSTRIERASLLPPCEVCRDRTHLRQFHGELVQTGNEVITSDEWRVRQLDDS